MKYRKFGRMDWEASILGFGVMALPLMEGDRTRIDEAESIRMIRYAVDKGVNYIDSGYPYDPARHESRTRLLRRALADGHGEKVKIAATLPPVLISSPSDFDLFLDNQLRQLEMGGIDFLLLGWLNRDNWPLVREMGILPRAEQAMKDGRIDRLGFSFHDDFQGLRTILDDYDNWTLCQFQYSYMDVNHHPGAGGIRHAADRGLAIVAVEPLRGGRLIKGPPTEVAEIWAEEESEERSLTEWGLRWVWNHPEVSAVVSDMSCMGQVEERITIAESAEPDSLSVREVVLISRVREAYNKLRPVPCTGCRACMPCPEGIDVPRIFEIYNDAVIYDDIEKGRSIYMIEGHCADACVECDSCTDSCAKALDMTKYLKDAYQLLTGSDG